MKWSKALVIVSLAALWSTAALAQDPVKVDPAHYKLVFENPSVRVLAIKLCAGRVEQDASASGLDRDPARHREGPLHHAGR